MEVTSLRSLAILALILGLFISVARAGDWPEDCGKAKSHNFYFGGRGYNDRILYVNQTIRTGSILRKQSFDVEIPPPGRPRTGTISYVEVLDQFTNGKGACAYLKSGGPGFNYVTLHFKTQRGEGMNFITNVFGSP